MGRNNCCCPCNTYPCSPHYGDNGSTTVYYSRIGPSSGMNVHTVMCGFNAQFTITPREATGLNNIQNNFFYQDGYNYTSHVTYLANPYVWQTGMCQSGINFRWVSENNNGFSPAGVEAFYKADECNSNYKFGGDYTEYTITGYPTCSNSLYTTAQGLIPNYQILQGYAGGGDALEGDMYYGQYESSGGQVYLRILSPNLISSIVSGASYPYAYGVPVQWRLLLGPTGSLGSYLPTGNIIVPIFNNGLYHHVSDLTISPTTSNSSNSQIRITSWVNEEYGISGDIYANTINQNLFPKTFIADITGVISNTGCAFCEDINYTFNLDGSFSNASGIKYCNLLTYLGISSLSGTMNYRISGTYSDTLGPVRPNVGTQGHLPNILDTESSYPCVVCGDNTRYSMSNMLNYNKFQLSIKPSGTGWEARAMLYKSTGNLIVPTIEWTQSYTGEPNWIDYSESNWNVVISDTGGFCDWSNMNLNIRTTDTVGMTCVNHLTKDVSCWPETAGYTIPDVVYVDVPDIYSGMISGIAGGAFSIYCNNQCPVVNTDYLYRYTGDVVFPGATYGLSKLSGNNIGWYYRETGMYNTTRFRCYSSGNPSGIFDVSTGHLIFSMTYTNNRYLVTETSGGFPTKSIYAYGLLSITSTSLDNGYGFKTIHFTGLIDSFPMDCNTISTNVKNTTLGLWGISNSLCTPLELPVYV